MFQVEISVVSRDPVPQFTQPLYSVTLEENLQPPQLLVDLDTNDEMSGIMVRYFIEEGGKEGKLDLHNNTVTNKSAMQNVCVIQRIGSYGIQT